MNIKERFMQFRTARRITHSFFGNEPTPGQVDTALCGEMITQKPKDSRPNKYACPVCLSLLVEKHNREVDRHDNLVAHLQATLNNLGRV